MVKRRVVTFLEEEDIEKLKENSKRLYGKESIYRITADLVLKGLDDIERGRRTGEKNSRPREPDREPEGANQKEPDWKRKYEEYRRKYGGTPSGTV